MKTQSLLFAPLIVAANLMIPPAAVAAEIKSEKAQAQQQQQQESQPCHWWQFRKCRQPQADGLPPDAPRQGAVVTVDVSTNTAYLYNDGELVTKAPAATGTEKVLKHGSRIWLFHTPRGHLKVLRKVEDPVWTKPDWAFIEDGEPVPPLTAPERRVRGHLGKYALDLGDGIMIHGTDDTDSLGKRASHGCIRLPAAMLAKVWRATKIGTDVYIYDSQPQTAAVSRLSDLE